MIRFLPANLTTLLVELEDLDETLALFGALRAAPLPGIKEMVPAARTLMLSFAPEVTNAEELALQISGMDLSRPVRRVDKFVEVPVDYRGEDLPEVARLTGLEVAEIVRRHAGCEYEVAFCGFAPGFGYLVGGDPALHVPRRKTPRTRIPAGSVGLAGHFTGVYPQESPGGWQLIGTTPVKMWDIGRTPPAYFQPGYRVRFFDLAAGERIFSIPKAVAPPPAPPPVPPPREAVMAFSILTAPLPALFQDLGRFGQTGQGVSLSGALDQGAFKSANRLTGNPSREPCLELTGGGFSFRSHGRAVIGIAGAPCDISVRAEDGRMFSPRPYAPFALEAGDVVRLSAPKAGARSYLSVRGGFVVEKTLGSASADTLAIIGPAPVRAGDRLGVKPAGALPPVSLFEPPAFMFPKPGETVMLDLILGPRPDWFTPESLVTLRGTDWEVSAQSNRVGIRLNADARLARAGDAELPSEGCVNGAVEIPPDGKPLLFLADHPLTGGYPVIGAVAEYHLDLAGQLPVGARVRFRPLAPFSEITPKTVAV
ncbi:carboxyltransferase domain-containing protein [Acidocella sp.]|uniref:5-oxoprolinase subunit B/C family protein n=1 Tax=Acidocella sp. TaxID=50710 RepID=UPI003CFCF905